MPLARPCVLCGPALVGLLLWWCPGAARAQAPVQPGDAAPDGAPALLDGPAPWTVRLEPMLWYPALRGDVALPASSTLDVSQIDIDENEWSPAGRLTLKAERWSVQYRGFGFETDHRGAVGAPFTLGGGAVGAGATVASRLELSSFDLTAAYRFPLLDDRENGVSAGLDVFGGGRVHSLDVAVRSAGAGVSADETWIQPIVGARAELDLPHGLGLNVSLDLGAVSFGDRSAASWDVTVGFTWRPTKHIGAEIGFRHLQSDLSTEEGAGDFEFDAGLAGLFAAIVIRF